MKYDVDVFMRQLRALDALRTKSGVPPVSDLWWQWIERSYRSGKRQIVIRKGRRVGASTIICPLIAAATALYLPHPIPPSDIGVFGFLSVNRDEAQARIRGIAAVLDLLGVKFEQKDGEIRLLNKPVVFRVLTASYRNEVGSTSLWADEVSRWRDEATGSNPAREIFASLKPSMATMPFARAWLVSSVLSVEDYHARCHDEGDTAFQNVECGSTWDLNPQLTREDCLALESDPRVFDREYGAIPSASLAGAFDPAHCVNAFRALPNGCRYYPAIGVLDTAAGKRVGSDKMTWGRFQIAELPAPPEFLTRLVPRRNHCRIGGADVILDDPYERISDYERDANGLPRRNPEFSNARTPVLALTGIDSVGGVFHEGLVDGSLWKRIGQFFHWGGVHDVYGDGYGGPQTHKELRRFGIRYHELRWDNEAKSKAVYRLRHLMASGALYLQQHEQLRAELLSYQEKISPSGVVSYAGRGATKDDHVSLLLNAAMVEHERALPGSPLYQQRTRHEVKLTGGSENIF